MLNGKYDSVSRVQPVPLTLYYFTSSPLLLQELLFRVVQKLVSKRMLVALPVAVLTRAPRTVVPTVASTNSSAAVRMPPTTSTLSSGRRVPRTLSVGSFGSSPWRCLVIWKTFAE
jgi:hypothetical protein